MGAATVFDEVLSGFGQQWETWSAPVSEWLDAGDTIIAIGEYRGKHRQTGKSMRAAFAHVYRVKEGRIIRFQQFTDTAMIRSALT